MVSGDLGGQKAFAQIGSKGGGGEVSTPLIKGVWLAKHYKTSCFGQSNPLN